MKSVQMPRMILKKKIVFSEYSMSGTIGEEMERPDIIPFLQYIQDNSESLKEKALSFISEAFPGLHTPKTPLENISEKIAEHLLGNNSRKYAAKAILNFCESSNLIKNNNGTYILTDDGKTALDRECIFIQRRGIFSVWVADDSQKSLDFLQAHSLSQILKISPEKERVDFKSAKEEAKQPIPPRSVPSCLSWVSENNPSRPDIVSEKCRIELIEYMNKTGRTRDVHFEWDILNQTLRIADNDKKNDILTAFILSEQEKIKVLNTLLQSAGASTWIKSKGVPLSFEAASKKAALKNFQADFTPKAQEIPISLEALSDIFDCETLKDVPVFPGTDGDERQWVDYLFRDKLNGYLTTNKQKQIVKEITEAGRFSPENITQGVPSRNSLIEEYRESDTRKFWWTVAPEDWSL